MALWKGQCGCTGLRCLTCSDGLDKVSGQTAESGRQETDNTLIERGESRRKCLLRKIQWVSQKIKNKNLMWVLVIDRIGIKKFEFQTIHSDLSILDCIWKYHYFKWQIYRAAMLAVKWGVQRNPACPCVSLFFADSAKCLHEANTLCQILD